VSGESKVGFLNKLHPANLLHKVCSYDGADFRKSRALWMGMLIRQRMRKLGKTLMRHQANRLDRKKHGIIFVLHSLSGLIIGRRVAQVETRSQTPGNSRSAGNKAKRRRMGG
jgi:hypothetical protein